MKYISVVILIVLMSWTWQMATTERAFSLDQHKRVETGVEADIRAFIISKYPQTTELYCQELYTEVVKADTDILAHFRCRSEGKSGSEEVISQTFEGQLKLQSDNGFNNWKVIGGEIRSPELAFQNGLRVTREEPGAESAPAPAPVAPKPQDSRKHAPKPATK